MEQHASTGRRGREITVLTEETPGKEGRRVSEIVSVAEEACVRCGGGSAFQTQVQAGAVPSPQQLRGPGGASYEGPMTDCPTKGKLRPVGTVRGDYNCVRGGRPSVDGRSLTAFT